MDLLVTSVEVWNIRAPPITVVPLFSNKNSKSENEDRKTVSDEKQLCRIFSTYFANIFSYLKIRNIRKYVPDIRSNHDPVLDPINTFQNHPSVVYIIQREFNTSFIFNNTNEDDFREILKTWMFIKLVKVVTFQQKS